MMNRASACRNGRPRPRLAAFVIAPRLAAFVIAPRLAVLAIALCAGTAGVAAQSSKGSKASGGGEIHAQLRVEAQAQCATRETLAARVATRSRRIRFVDADRTRGVPRLVVQVTSRAAQAHDFTLDIEWPDGARAQRRLTAHGCDSGLDAMALLLAMTLDPSMQDAAEPARADVADAGVADAGSERGTRPPRGAGKGSAEAPADATDARRADGATDAGAGAPASAGEDTAAEPTDEDGQVQSPAATDSAEPADPAPIDDVEEADAPLEPDAHDGAAQHPLGFDHLALGVLGQLAFEIAPEPLTGVGIYALIALQGAGAWAPALELQLVYGWASDIAQDAGSADFALDGARLGACPLGLRLGAWSAHACLTGSLGRLSARGSDSYSPQTHERVWASAGGAARLSLALAETLELQAGVGLAGPLERYGFAFRPEVFHRVPALYLYSHLGVGVRFP